MSALPAPLAAAPSTATEGADPTTLAATLALDSARRVVPDADLPLVLTPSEERLLRALDDATRAHKLYTEAIVALVQRERAAHEQLTSLTGRSVPLVREKSPEHDRLEAERRQAKYTMRRAIDLLCQGRLYTRDQLLVLLATDGDADVLHPEQQAIGQADLDAALASCPNHYARRALLRRVKLGQDDTTIARDIGSRERDINKLVNIALDHVDRYLNARVVNQVQQEYLTYCLAYGLSFPDYEQVRGG